MQRVVGSPEVGTIGPAGLADLLQHGRVVVVDNNPETRWAVGHVPGAVNLDPADYQREDLGADSDDTPLVFYCRVPAAAPRTTPRNGRCGWAFATCG